jgi:hypothetical protein
MKRFSARFWWAWALVLALLPGGCKKPKQEDPGPTRTIQEGGGPGVVGVFPSVERTVTAVELKQFYFYYNEMCENKTIPKKLSDMKSLQLKAQKYYKAIEDGDLVVCWGGNTQALGGNPGGTVLAYGKGVLEKPGAVLMLNGDVNPQMTPEEFKKAPKAGGK